MSEIQGWAVAGVVAAVVWRAAVLFIVLSCSFALWRIVGIMEGKE